MINAGILLELLGCESNKPLSEAQPCPLHPHNTPSLHVVSTPDSCLFCCTACGFELDAVQLTARARRISEEAALQEFLPGHPLSPALDDSMAESHLQAYLNRRESQALIHDFLAACHRGLTETDAGRLALQELTQRGLLCTYVPEAAGVLLQDRVPPQLPQLMRPEFGRQIFLTYAYKLGPLVTAIVLRGLTDDSRHVIQLVPGERGVFADNQTESAPTQLVLVQSEQMAVKLMSQGRHYGTKNSPVACLLGTELPFRYRNVKTVHILTSPSAPLGLSQALRLAGTDKLISGALGTPPIRVTYVPAEGPPASQIVPPDTSGSELLFWLAGALDKLYQDKGAVGVRTVLQSVPSVPNQAVHRALRISHASKELIALFDLHEEWNKNSVRLSTGAAVYRRPDGFAGAEMPDKPATLQLTNFQLHFQQVLRDRDGGLFFRVTVAVPGQPPESVLLPETAFSEAAVLRRAISGVFYAKGKIVTIAVHGRKEFPWPEIRDVFARLDGAEVVQEVTRLGVTADLSIELPALRIIECAKSMVPQDRLISIPDAARCLYSGLRPCRQRAEELAAFRTLWTSERPGDAALAGMLSHAAFCLVQAVACRRESERPPLRHLGLIDTPPDIWLPVLRQYGYITAGVTRLNRLAAASWRALKALEPLGDLPFPTVATDEPRRHSVAVIDRTPLHFIAAVTPDQAEQLVIRADMSCLDPEAVPAGTPEPADEAAVAQLRAEFPEFLRQMLDACWGMSAEACLEVRHPALALYTAAAQVLDVRPAATLSQLATDAYVNCSGDILPRFFKGLRELFYGATPSCRVAFGAQKLGSPGQQAYLTDHAAFISRGILTLMNGLAGPANALSERRVSRQLDLFGFLAPLEGIELPESFNPGWHWAIVRDIWDSRVALANSKPLTRLLRVKKVG